MTDVILSLQDATIRTATQHNFPGITFAVRNGEHWAFVGENEALKTALLEALAGKASIIQGKISHPFFEAVRTHHGDDPFLSPRRFIQYLSFRHPFRNLANTTDFYYQQRFNTTDAENASTVSEYLAPVQGHAKEPVWTFEKVVAGLRLRRLLDEKLIKLSNGETKRVLLAAALLRHPVILLLHHPFAGLDAAARNEVAELLNKIAGSGTTLILATAPQEIPACITHVAVFDYNGTITPFLKTDLNPAALVTSPTEAVDETELKTLLSLNPMPRFNDMVHMKNVSIRYGDSRILDNINWTIKQGERWALSGPNGSGKSTLLSLINGDNPQAFANDIILFDRRKGSGESIWDIKKKIGFFSPELYQYFPLETSCLQAVESGFYDTIGLFRPSHTYTAGIALRWMKLLHIDHLASKALRNVLPVQQRLCLLARALVKSPPLLLLDEPCQGFDAAEVARFKQLIDLVCMHSHVTLIYVSHYTAELPDCITKHYRLQNGRQVSG